MKIVRVLGGLGNQMFQYALYIALKEHFYNEKVMIDISCFAGYSLHNGFELDKIFSINPSIATWQDIVKVAYPYPNYRCWQIGKYILPNRKTMCIESKDFAINQTVLVQNGNRYFDGYWQHEEYFFSIRDKIYEAFTFPKIINRQNREMLSRVISTNSVSIHVRRGDYVNHPFFKGICELDYYKSSIEYLKKNTKAILFCIFSNDVEWCKKEFSLILSPDSVVYVDWNIGKDSYVDMQIMSNCKHNIIANSSFSWWGAWLNRNPEKIVIAPSKWMNITMEKDPVPTSWRRI